jgi:ribulose-phosphate 3-epimerase
MASIILSASILSADFSNLGDQIREVETGGIDWIHVDVMDGHFVPNITMGPFIVRTCRKITQLPLDVHLMIENPERHIEAFAEAGASSLTIHIENNPNVHRTLQAIRSMGVRPAIALNPGTPPSHIEAILGEIDMVLVMTVNPGFSGQSFIPASYHRVAQVRKMAQERELPLHIQVDGGVNSETLPKLFAAGADVFVSATTIFKNPSGISAGIHALRKSIEL